MQKEFLKESSCFSNEKRTQAGLLFFVHFAMREPPFCIFFKNNLFLAAFSSKAKMGMGKKNEEKERDPFIFLTKNFSVVISRLQIRDRANDVTIMRHTGFFLSLFFAKKIKNDRHTEQHQKQQIDFHIISFFPSHFMSIIFCLYK
jgi:hypothetical protein